MPTVTLPLLRNLPQFGISSVIDILLVATLIYQLIVIVKGRRAASVVFGVAILGLVYFTALTLRLELLRTVLATLAPYTPIALIVMFQSEMRRALGRLGRAEVWRPASGLERRDLVRDIQFAAKDCSVKGIGALIVLERDMGLRTFVESGTRLDACVSRELLLSLFEPKTALHDGAVILRRDRIVAAGCFLPLTMNPQLARQYGTRHRAAIGITEEADCITVVVSEETHKISIAAFGELDEDVSEARLETRLMAHLGHKEYLNAPKRSRAIEETPTSGNGPAGGDGTTVPAKEDHSEVNRR